ncbi:MAG: hypothetical protein IJU76_06755 [Desulfovibrionaceae bacterium]|nr:hypothetical protein [Desulfovibrionaceae bacterium]
MGICLGNQLSAKARLRLEAYGFDIPTCGLGKKSQKIPGMKWSYLRQKAYRTCSETEL